MGSRESLPDIQLCIRICANCWSSRLARAQHRSCLSWGTCLSQTVGCNVVFTAGTGYCLCRWTTCTVTCSVTACSTTQLWSRQRASGVHVRHWLATQLAAATLAAHKRRNCRSTTAASAAGPLGGIAGRGPSHLPAALIRARPSARTGAGSDAQTVSKGIACVLVFSVMPPHFRGHMSFCAFGWDVILYRPPPDAVLEFHDPSDYVRYVCMLSVGDETENIWCLSALP